MLFIRVSRVFSSSTFPSWGLRVEDCPDRFGDCFMITLFLDFNVFLNLGRWGFG